MIKRFTLLILAVFTGYISFGQDLIITGAADGPLTGGTPKVLELYATDNIADLSLYAIGSANNGGGTDGPEFILSGSATAGDYIYIASEIPNFNAFFGFDPDLTTTAMGINGDDAIELFFDATGLFTGSESVVDVFGTIDCDPNAASSPCPEWEHTDGWAYRKDGTTAGGSTFTTGDWIYSGIDALDNETTNASAANPFPIGTYSESAPTNTIVTFATETGSAIEDDGTTTITVSIENPSASVATTVDVALTSGNAANLNNYTTQTVTFPANSSADQTVTITITDNMTLEGTQIYVFNLQNVGGGSTAEVGVEDEFTLSVTDDERSALSNTVDPTTCDLFTIQDVTLNDQSDSWSCTNGTYQVNGFCNGCTASATETWLVSAAYDFSGATLVGFEYSTLSGFDDNSNLPELRVSTDYAGDVSTATWTTITTIDNDDGSDVFVDLTTELAGESFGVVAVKYVTVAPGSAAEATTLTDVELLGNGIVAAPFSEPTNQPTGFSTSRLEFDVIELVWLDALAGDQAPTGYLILGSTGAIVDPVDGVSPAEDLDPSDGSLAALIPFGTTEIIFEGFDGGDTFNFSIYSYSNSADAIDYNVTSAPSLASVSTPDEIFLADFEGMLNLYNIPKLSIHDIDADDSWYYDSFSGDNFAEMSSSSDGDVEEDWLIFGPFNFDAYTGETFSFVSSLGFDAEGAPLSVRYSTDFEGNVSDAMWTALSPTLSLGGFNDTYSGLIDVSTISGQVYFAFVYEEDEAAMAEANGTVQIDDIKISGTSSATGVTSVAAANTGTNLSLAASTTTTGNLTVNDLTLGDIDDVDLTIASGNTLTIYGNVRIEDGSSLIIQDGASLIRNGDLFTADGVVTIERSTTFSTSAGRYSTIGTIIEDQSTSTLGSLVYSYDESISFDTDNGLNRFVEVTTPEIMSPGVGYFSANLGDLTLGGAGAIPNNGGYVVPATFSGNSAVAANDGFNLVANPYPAAIDFLNFLDINSTIDGTIYIWDDGGSEAGRRTNADYITVNELGTASAGSSRASDWDGSIRAGQGFFIRTEANVDVVFTNDIRVAGGNDSGGFFRQETRETTDILNLSISNKDFMSTTLIGFKADATVGRDRKYDAYKYAGNTDLQIYSLIDEASFAIQGLPELNGEEYTVNLGYSAAEAGIYTINADEIVISDGYQVVLIDKLMDVSVNLSDVGSYTFTTQTETANNDRFSISFRTSVISSVKEEIGNKLLVFSDFQNVNISLENGSVIDQFTVYTLSGQELISGINEEQSVKVNKNLFTTGVNIIKAKSGDATYTLKFILK